MSKPLITEDARRDLRNRPSVTDLLARHHVMATVGAALMVGGANYVGMQAAGASTADSLAIAIAVAAAVLGFFFVASALAGRPVLPDLFARDNEPGWIDESVEFDAAWQAANKARRRNLAEGDTGAYWIETQLPSGRWTVELRGRRRGRPDHSDGSGPTWFDMYLGDSGGGAGGGDGGAGGGG